MKRAASSAPARIDYPPSLLDRFAMAALTGLLAATAGARPLEPREDAEFLAAAAFDIAKEMLEESERRHAGEIPA